MPFILINSRQHRRVLIISFKQSFSRRTTYISSGILQKPTLCPSLHSHSYRKHQSDLSSQPQTLRLSQSHPNTMTGSTSPFMVTSDTPIKSKVRCYNHSNTHAYAHTSHSKTQVEGGGM